LNHPYPCLPSDLRIDTAFQEISQQLMHALGDGTSQAIHREVWRASVPGSAGILVARGPRSRNLPIVDKCRSLTITGRITSAGRKLMASVCREPGDAVPLLKVSAPPHTLAELRRLPAEFAPPP